MKYLVRRIKNAGQFNIQKSAESVSRTFGENRRRINIISPFIGTQTANLLADWLNGKPFWRLDKIIAFIEFDGEQHDKPSDFFGGEKGFKERKINDQIKNDFAKQKGIPLIRIKYKDLNNIESVLQEELKKINIYIDINKTNVI
ncbi:hypothetical protein [Ureibacillus sp. FSL K6-2830]|uniref:hypothetical protein n=1 Tax=Ureibacillus sp. FSL K6-2830 TaxID=2954610 RepID=UPI0030F560B0